MKTFWHAPKLVIYDVILVCNRDARSQGNGLKTTEVNTTTHKGRKTTGNIQED